MRTPFSLTRLRRLRYVAAAVGIAAAGTLVFAGTASAANPPGAPPGPAPATLPTQVPIVSVTNGTLTLVHTPTAAEPYYTAEVREAPSSTKTAGPVVNTPLYGEGVCYLYWTEPEFHSNNSTMNALTWVNNCNGYEAACSTAAVVQSYYPNDREWYDEFYGPTRDGCFGEYSEAVANCIGYRYAEDYRTRGIYTIVWDDGSYNTDVTDSVAVPYPLLCPP